MSRASAHPGYDDFLDAIDADAGYYLHCQSGHGVVPPARRCPVCGDVELEKRQLPETGVLEDVTTIHVAPTAFEGAAPYHVGLARFGSVTVTGRVRGLDDAETATGTDVVPSAEPAASGDARLLVLRPTE
ncbi:Zn-ribbon domain-containing OB-fold protein [Haloarchaeobius amylolyticus]|uniref:Zn-ribbon domain-containing OB-fold protein n=1 Tax=Haloarchaeobius amylolyticus TaxID=1198296 RepID=UPI00226E3D66